MLKRRKENLIDKDFWSSKSKDKKYIDVDENLKPKNSFKKIINIIVASILVIWISLILVDYFRTENNKEPLFCYFNKQVTEYDNGKVKECIGLGYKVIEYDLDENGRLEFGPFWISADTIN